MQSRRNGPCAVPRRVRPICTYAAVTGILREIRFQLETRFISGWRLFSKETNCRISDTAEPVRGFLSVAALGRRTVVPNVRRITTTSCRRKGKLQRRQSGNTKIWRNRRRTLKTLSAQGTFGADYLAE